MDLKQRARKMQREFEFCPGARSLISALLFWNSGFCQLHASITWTISPISLGDGIRSHGAASTDDGIYIFGGYGTNSGFITTGTLYDPGAGSFNPQPSVNALGTSSITGIRNVSVGNSVYYTANTTGGTATSGHELFKISTSDYNVSVVTPQIHQVEYSALTYASSTGHIYMSGGLRNANQRQSHLQVYDTTSDIWTQGTAMNTARDKHTMSYAEGSDSLYVFGGVTGFNTSLNTIEIYDIANNQWNVLTETMSTPRQDASSITIGTDIYIIGGRDGFGNALNTVERFDTLNNTITTEDPLPVNFSLGAVVEHEGEIYLIGGYDGTSNLDTIIIGAVNIPEPAMLMLTGLASIFGLLVRKRQGTT